METEQNCLDKEGMNMIYGLCWSGNFPNNGDRTALIKRAWVWSVLAETVVSLINRNALIKKVWSTVLAESEQFPCERAAFCKAFSLRSLCSCVVLTCFVFHPQSQCCECLPHWRKMCAGNCTCCRHQRNSQDKTSWSFTLYTMSFEQHPWTFISYEDLSHLCECFYLMTL